MSRIHGKDTKPELAARKWLFSHGYRYRKNVQSLPGKPDIVLPKYKTVIFVHGCFWHRHAGCNRATTPGTNTDYWEKKFCRNVENDLKHVKELEKMGWHVITLWECELKSRNIEATMLQAEQELNKNQ